MKLDGIPPTVVTAIIVGVGYGCACAVMICLAMLVGWWLRRWLG